LPLKLSAGAKRGSARQRRLELDAQELLRKRDAFAGTDAEFGQRYGKWARERELGCSPSTLAEYRRRLARGEPIDGRVRSGRKATPIDEELFELVYSAFMQENDLPLTEILRYVNGVARQQSKEELNYDAVLRRLKRDVSHRECVRYREGKEAFEARCVPKVQRDYESIPASEWWCLDGRVMDIMARVPDSRREWRRERLVLMGVSDLRSRSLKLVPAVTENSDAILASIKLAGLDWGLPRHSILDNGTAYKAAAGGRRTRKQRAYLRDGRVGSAFAQLGVTVHLATPYRAWVKPIESLWNKLKRGLDKWFWCYWGGTPAERPEYADAWTKLRIDKLPTLEEIVAALGIFLDEYHALEQGGRGTFGLSPNLVMEQFRGEVRRVDPDVLDEVCCRTVGPRKVREDGTLVWRNVLFGAMDPEMLELAGRPVWIRVHPERFDRLSICDSAGRPLCYATNRQLTNATQEDFREAMRTQARSRRVERQYPAARNFLIETPVTQILGAKRTRAQAAEAEQRKQLPPPPEPAVTIVRGDLAEPVKRLREKSRPFKRLAQSVNSSGDARTPEPPTRGQWFARYAKQTEQACDDGQAERRPVSFRGIKADGTDADAEETRPDFAGLARGNAEAG